MHFARKLNVSGSQNRARILLQAPIGWTLNLRVNFRFQMVPTYTQLYVQWVWFKTDVTSYLRTGWTFCDVNLKKSGTLSYLFACKYHHSNSPDLRQCSYGNTTRIRASFCTGTTVSGMDWFLCALLIHWKQCIGTRHLLCNYAKACPNHEV